MDANLLTIAIDHRSNSPRMLVSKMLHLVQNDAALMPAYSAIADHVGGKVLQCKALIDVVEKCLTERYIKKTVGGGEDTARRYVCSFLDNLVEHLFLDAKTWPITKEALHKKFSCVSDVSSEATILVEA